MNTAVLMFSACLAGAGQGPVAAPPGYAPYPAYPAPAYAAPAYPTPVYSAPGYPAQPAPVVVATPGRASVGGDCCGHASVCGDCDGQAKKCCILDKIKSKLSSCLSFDLCGKCDKGCAPECPKPVCNPCPKPVCQPCPKPACPPCPKPVCNPCPKPVCNPCPQPAPVCCKSQPVCHDTCSKPCWTPGYFLHKCKEKLGCGDKGKGCHGGCATAATPTGCGSTVIAPATPDGCGTAVIPPVVAPATPVTPVEPDVKKVPEKVGSNYGPVQTGTAPTSTTTPRTIDLGSIPF